MKITVIAKKRIGRYRPGDEFTLSRADANAYIRLGIVEERASSISEGVAPSLMSASLIQEGAEALGAPIRHKRRAYKRRDMRAED